MESIPDQYTMSRPYQRGGFGLGYRGASRGGNTSWGTGPGTGGNSRGGGNNRGTGTGTGGNSRGWGNNRGTGGQGHKKKIIDNRGPLEPENLPKGPVLAEVTSKDLVDPETVEGEGTGKIKKEDYELLASYNWLPKEVGGEVASIVVPGLAARWAPPRLPAWLNPDTGTYYIDQNAHRCPICPLEPLFRAVFTLHPQFDPNDIDIVTDRNNLRKLFRFTRGNIELSDFKFFIEVINKTVLLTRWEPKAAGVIEGGEFWGFGHSFEKEFTKYTKGLELSTGHHRVCRYKFGGLNVLCRFSADAFLGSKEGPTEDETKEAAEMVASVPPVDRRSGKAHPAWRPKQVHTDLLDDPLSGNESQGGSSKSSPLRKPPSGDARNCLSKSVASPVYVAPMKWTDPDDLADILSNVSLKAKPKKTPMETPLEVTLGGALMPQHRVLEVKTRTSARPIDLTDQIPQLWFSATSNLYVGYHQRGSFTNVDTKVMDATSLEKWEGENQSDLMKMGRLLSWIVEIARGVEGGRAQVACVKGELKIYGIGEEEVAVGTLPQEIRSRWDSK